MVTASHNPKADAGFKVYWSNGCQITSPTDSNIADSIEKQENLKPWVDYGSILSSRMTNASSYTDSCFGYGDTKQTETIVKDYYAAVVASGLVSNQSAKYGQNFKICYSK